MITELLAMPSTERALTLHSLMKEPSSYLKYLVDDLQGLVDQYVNPWKATDLGKWLCNTEGRPFTRPNDADPDLALMYKEILSKTLMEAYACCYQSIDQLKTDLEQKKLPHDEESIYQLLSSIREEVITEYLLQQKLFSLDYSPNESENTADENRTKILLQNAGVSKSSIRSFALGLASALTGIDFSSLADPSNEIHNILTKATSSGYSPFDSTIAGLLLIASKVKNSNADDETSDKNVALRLALRGDPGMHELDMLHSSYNINSACHLPVIRHPGTSRMPIIYHRNIYRGKESVIDRKWNYIFAYRLSREENNKVHAQLHREVIPLLVTAGAHFTDDWGKLDQFVFINTNINVTDEAGKTALHTALLQSDRDLFERLLAAGANPNIPNRRGETPLHIAVQRNYALIEKLLNSGADACAYNAWRETPLLQAVQENNESAVDKLLTIRPSIDEKNKWGDTPLHIATQNNYLTIIKKLLNAGADTCAYNASCETPLHLAVRENKAATVAVLLTARPPINEKNSRGDTPLHIATQNNYFTIIEKLLNAGADTCAYNASCETPLHLAVRENKAATVAVLLTARPPINEKNSRGDTPLHIATQNNYFTIIEKLLNAGADTCAYNASCETPLHLAVRENKAATVAVLLTARPPINEKNSRGDTPLHIAVQKKYLTIIQKLLNAGANINATNNNGDTPLHIAVQEGSFWEIDKLLTAGANVNAINNEGDTPSHLAVRLPAISCSEDFFISDPLKLYFNPVNKIVSAGANLNIMNHNGDTPLHIAVRDGSFENIYLMLKRSPDLTLKNRDGKTAWDLARVTNDFSILYPLAGTLNQRVQTLALHPLAKVAPIALLIGSALGIVIGKTTEKRLATNALKSIKEKLSSHADEKLRILYKGQALLTPLSQKSTLTMEEIEIDALKELLDTDLMKDLTKELTVLHKYRRALSDNQLHVEWANLYKAHQDFFDVWDKVYTSFTRQSKLTSGETLDFMNKHFQLPLMIHTLKEEIFYRTPSDRTHQDALSNKQATVLSQES